jgi:hypothetical protein
LSSRSAAIAGGNHDGRSTRQRQSCFLHLSRIAEVRQKLRGCPNAAWE